MLYFHHYLLYHFKNIWHISCSNIKWKKYSRMDQVKVVFHKFYLVNTSSDIFLYIFLYMRTVNLIPMSGAAQKTVPKFSVKLTIRHLHWCFFIVQSEIYWESLCETYKFIEKLNSITVIFLWKHLGDCYLDKNICYLDIHNSSNIYLFKVKNRNTKKGAKYVQTLTVKTPSLNLFWFLLLSTYFSTIVNILHTFFYCFYCWL